jgi:predicted transcriptional regulator
MTEAMDMDGRLDQLVRAGLMPTSSLPLLKRAISRMHAGMSLQGAERDVMNMFISSMMFIVLGDDTVFNKARAGAKTYAAEEVSLDEENNYTVAKGKQGWFVNQNTANGVHHHSVQTGYHDSKQKAVAWAKNHAGSRAHKIDIKEAKEKTEYDYEGDMAMGQLKSIIANSQRMHDMLSDDTNLPEWVQSKITLAEDYISTASNYMQGEMNEEKDMPFKGPYRKVGERKDKYGNTVKNVPKFLAKKAMNKQKNEEVEQIDEILPVVAGAAARYAAGKAGAGVVGRTVAGAATKYAVSKSMNKEEVEVIDELSKKTMGSYVKKASGAEQPKNVMSPKNVPLTKIAAYQGDSETGHFGKRFNQATYDKAERLRKNRETGIKRAVDKITKEDVEVIDELSKKTMGRYINKAKDSIDMTSYRSGIKDGTAISSSTPYKSNNPLEKKLTKRHKGIETAVKKLTKEESENLDELSKATMGRYINKAATKMGSQGVTAGLKIAADEKSSKNFKDMGKREKGISRAVNKLTKEDIDAVKQMNESYKTAFETALNEYGIKSPSELDESKRKEFFNHVDLEFKKGDN